MTIHLNSKAKACEVEERAEGRPEEQVVTEISNLFPNLALDLDPAR